MGRNEGSNEENSLKQAILSIMKGILNNNER
jgi:hypothetical protein